ncbi:hypothetical protein FRACYDRAFT_247433 [Fragilariopsis cylindrus CCMP1102]|uniref:Uncharacterized protein n=1 Tax=Fragilariopsis cylindrus CCMP1102 TaxID=635003 RepID=A0A1E7EX44_9STRA|nr:hypothetical protein FRACYDRAFT_247433 [Fragilariopsis cylindrus CCMP1102]|eukprot:OEU10384.1 hypothetical protein FRACYDRAFT_247433 [Fragilariopsis cylindrus CCMP1102]
MKGYRNNSLYHVPIHDTADKKHALPRVNCTIPIPLNGTAGTATAASTYVAVAEPVMASGQHYYQTQPLAQAVMEPPPAVKYQQYHQYQEQSVASYSTILVASSATTDVVEQDAKECGIPEGGYRSSRGFGFVHRRTTFIYYKENNF